VTITYLLFCSLALGQGPGRDSLLAEGARLAAMEPGAALVRFEAILAADSSDLVANWRAATALNDLAEPLGDRASQTRHDSLLAGAERYGRRAVRLAPENARALFVLGLVLGNRALDAGLKERVRLAGEIRELALRAIAADSLLDAAHHLLGRWNYEVMRLSGLQRFIARNLLGGAVLREASWPKAETELLRAVALDSTRIYHRLDLARVYLARRNPAAAEAQLRAITSLPSRFAADTIYRRQAAELLETVGGKR